MKRLAAVLALLVAGCQGTPPPAPPASARAKPASRLSAAEPAEIREQLLSVLARQDARAERTKGLAALINPLFPRFAEAAPEAAALESETRSDQRMLTMLRERAIAYYPDAELVPDGELVLIARVLVNAARGWCWLENMANTREAIDGALAAHGDQFHDPKVLAEMDAKPYSAGGEVFVVESVRLFSEALRRMDAEPVLTSLEMGDLLTEVYWLASVTNFRTWPAEATSKLREADRALAAAGDGPLARAAMAIWQLGSIKHAPLKPAREAAHRALAGLAASGLPHAKRIVDRVERELETGRPTSSPAPSRAPAPLPAPDPRERPR